MAENMPGNQNAADQLMPRSTPPAPAGGSSGGGQPPLKPKQADSPQRGPSDDRLRRNLLISGVVVGFLFILILVIAVLTSGQGSNAILGAAGIEGDINAVLLKVVNFVFGIAGIISIISIVIGGFIYVVAAGNPREIKRARRILVTSVVMLIVLFISYILIYTLIKARQDETPTNQENQVVKIITNPDPAEGEAPLNIGFDIANLGTGGNYIYSWDLGDGEKDTRKTFNHTYKSKGQYNVQAIITSGEKTLATLSTVVTVTNAKPDVSITAQPLAGRAPLTVQFDGSKSKPVNDPNARMVKFEWNFGDSQATDKNPNTAEGEKIAHTFTQDGFYTVTLLATDSNGASQTASQQIEVGAEPNAPTAVITSTPPATGFAPLSVRGMKPFALTLSGSKSRDVDGQVTQYRWDYGDGSPAENGQAVNHTFTESGTYTTTLTVTDNDGKTNTTDLQVTVANPGQTPHAVILSTPPANVAKEIKGDVPLTIALDGSKSTDSDGQVSAYEWNLGDNSPLLNGDKVEYTYKTPGTYTLVLTVTDNDGFTNIEPVTLTIKALQPGPKNPEAVIKTDPNPASGNIPFLVQFDGSDSSDEDGSIISYEWDFGDGKSILSGAQVSHTYDTAGIFTVTLTVHDNDNRTGRVSLPVAAHIPAPVAHAQANRTSGTSPLVVRFDASTSTGSIKKYDWDFDDEQSGQGRQISHTFEAPGEYRVKLIVTDTAEQVDSDEIVITVQ